LLEITLQGIIIIAVLNAKKHSEVKAMKTVLWLIILAALIIGGLFLYKNYSSKKTEAENAKVEEKVEAVQEKVVQEKANSEKGIKNWRAVKKVRNLSDQHNKDLEDNM
jgi:predicted negative regulator of RcsB-dependent stress response